MSRAGPSIVRFEVVRSLQSISSPLKCSRAFESANRDLPYAFPSLCLLFVFTRLFWVVSMLEDLSHSAATHRCVVVDVSPLPGPWPTDTQELSQVTTATMMVSLAQPSTLRDDLTITNQGSGGRKARRCGGVRRTDGDAHPEQSRRVLVHHEHDTERLPQTPRLLHGEVQRGKKREEGKSCSGEIRSGVW